MVQKQRQDDDHDHQAARFFSWFVISVQESVINNCITATTM